MAVYFLDSSALVKRYRTEQGTEVMKLLFPDSGSHEVLVVSSLVVVEMESTFARAVKAGTLSQLGRSRLLRQFQDDLKNRIGVNPLSGATMALGAEMARKHALRAGDALHLAVALQIRDAVGDAPVFVSSDKELVSAAQAETLDVLNPQQPGAAQKLER